MARRVILHVGLPKTGTTYLQTIMWRNRGSLREHGVLLPGKSVREHLWASLVVREDHKLARRHPDAEGAWDRIVAEVNEWPETAVISHEFFAGASREQAGRALKALGAADAHVVLTARELVGLVTARWQEFVKNGATVEVDRYPASEETDPADEWDWGTLDAADVLARWGASLPTASVHAITIPRPGAPRDELWRRFAGVVGIPPDSCDTSVSRQNESLGVVEVELLRRVNARLIGFERALDRGNWIRGYLAQGKLVPRDGERFSPGAARVEELRRRGRRIAEELRRRGYDVRGDLDDLLPPEELDGRRHPDSVTEAELLDSAVRTIAEMLSDVREFKQGLATLQDVVGEQGAQLEAAGVVPPGRHREEGEAAGGPDPAPPPEHPPGRTRGLLRRIVGRGARTPPGNGAR